MLVENHQRLYYTFPGSYISHDNILTEKDHRKRFYHTFFETYIDQEQNQTQKDIYQYFLNLKSMKNIFNCRRISTSSFITHLLIFVAVWNGL